MTNVPPRLPVDVRAVVDAVKSQHWQKAYRLANGHPVALAYIEQEKVKRIQALIAKEQEARNAHEV